jgi:hypothetical protein
MVAMMRFAEWYVWQNLGRIRVVKLVALRELVAEKVGLKLCVLHIGQKQMHVMQKGLKNENWS